MTRAPVGPSFQAAMAPSTAMDSPCPVNLMVARNPEARFSWERSTEPMTAEMLGALNTAIPTPMVAEGDQDTADGTRRVGELGHAGGDQDHADGGEHPGTDLVGQAAGERREYGHQHRLHEQQQAGLLRRQALNDLEIDRGERGHARTPPCS